MNTGTTNDDQLPIDPHAEERAQLIAKIDRGEPLTPADYERVATIGAADLARPRTPLGQAVFEVLQEAHALQEGDMAPGLSTHLDGATVTVQDGDMRLVTTVNAAGLLGRADEIAHERGD